MTLEIVTGAVVRLRHRLFFRNGIIIGANRRMVTGLMSMMIVGLGSFHFVLYSS